MEKHERLTKSRAPEFYGFVAWASTSFLFIVYLLWALLPDEWIEALGIDWYPNREWSVLFPAWSTVLVLFTYVVYWALALFDTPEFSNLSTIADPYVHVPPPNLKSNPYVASADKTSIPQLYDIPIGMVNRALYRKKTS